MLKLLIGIKRGEPFRLGATITVDPEAREATLHIAVGAWSISVIENPTPALLTRAASRTGDRSWRASAMLVPDAIEWVAGSVEIGGRIDGSTAPWIEAATTLRRLIAGEATVTRNTAGLAVRTRFSVEGKVRTVDFTPVTVHVRYRRWLTEQYDTWQWASAEPLPIRGGGLALAGTVHGSSLEEAIVNLHRRLGREPTPTVIH